MRVVLVSSMVVGWAFLAYACTSEDENPATTRNRIDAGEGGTVDPTNTPDGSLGAPICGDYGGYEKVKVIAGAILTKVSADCRISAPIASLSAESAKHLSECFAIQLGSAFQCPGVTYVAGTTKDSAGKSCRDMTSAHKGLNLRKADFDAFRDDLAASLTENKLTPDHVRSIAAFVEGTRNLVTQNNGDRNASCSCPNGEYMGKSCVPEAGILDAGTDSDAADSGDSG